MRITQKDLDTAFARMVHAAGHAGIAGTQSWILQHGSVPYGRAWRVYDVVEHGSYSDVLGSDGYLGSTASDAHSSLTAMARALELVTRS